MAEINPVAQRFYGTGNNTDGDGRLHIWFLNVGTGDCTYIKCPNGKRILIDAGTYSANPMSRKEKLHDIMGKLTEGNNYNAQHLCLDVLVLTHPHQDHYSYIHSLVNTSNFQWFYYGGNLDETAGSWFWNWYQNSENGMKCQGSQQLNTYAQNPPQIIEICDGTAPNSDFECHVEVLAASVMPTGNALATHRQNTQSVVTRIRFGGETILITGDATTDTEAWMLDKFGAGNLAATILRIPHHGSDTSSSQAFVDAVSPQGAIISCRAYYDKDGLPKHNVVQRYIDRGSLETVQTTNQITAYDPGRRLNEINTNRDINQTGISGHTYMSFTGQ